MNTKGGLTKRNTQMQEMQQKDTSLKGLIKAMEPEIKKALPSVITPERFTRMVLPHFPALEAPTVHTTVFLGAMMQAAQLGLEPNTPIGQAYLIPYGNSCQFQLEAIRAFLIWHTGLEKLKISRPMKFMKMMNLSMSLG